MEAKVVSQDPPKLLDQLRAEIRVRQYSIRTKQAYVDWVALALMAASVAAPFIYFRRKGWLR